MTDKEMLEYAAISVGYEVVGWRGEFFLVRNFDHITQSNDPFVWNPLEDDGDALRLAVKLGMEVYIDNHPEGCSCTEAESFTHKSVRTVYCHESDMYKATRYAIVRAAAEIGKNMP